MKSLDELVAEVQRFGVASTNGGLDRLASQARIAGWNAIASRPGGKPIEALEPTKDEEAHRRSISAQYGTGRQPLHTDCAHHQAPPDLLLLSVDEPSQVPTLLWGFDSAQFTHQQLTDLREGLFTVRTGSTAFLAPAMEHGRLRYDPVCMTPADPRSMRTAALIESLAETATPFHWNEPGRVLVINNRRFLHARHDASDEPQRSIKRMALRINKEAA